MPRHCNRPRPAVNPPRRCGAEARAVPRGRRHLQAVICKRPLLLPRPDRCAYLWRVAFDLVVAGQAHGASAKAGLVIASRDIETRAGLGTRRR